MAEDLDSGVDFAVVAYREEGEWQVAPLPPRAGTDLEVLVHALRQWPGDAGALGMVSVDEDFFVLARVQGDSVRGEPARAAAARRGRGRAAARR
jgi:putative tRNA adenosine deaminase-associated protein